MYIHKCKVYRNRIGSIYINVMYIEIGLDIYINIMYTEMRNI